VNRMAGLIDNVLDFARGRLGGGLSLTRNADEPLLPMLEQVIMELRSSHPDRAIEFVAHMHEPVSCDRTRIGQLLSNLASNALTHGTAGAPIRIEAFAKDGTFVLSVANQGAPIPDHLVQKLFEPFFRASARPSQQGLGLGLYIANEIARSHRGSLSVESTSQETRFTLVMPTL
jgi:phosphoserine phosphatase RsbU/P